MNLMCPLHSATLSCTKHNLYSPSWVTWGFQKILETTHSSWFTVPFTSFVHSVGFSLVRRRANFLHYGSLDSSIFQRFLGTAEIARFMRISISAGHSARLCLVRHKTSFFRHEWRENLTPQNVPEVTHTSRFTMILMSPVHSRSVTFVAHMTSFLRYEWLENSIFHRGTKDKSYLLFHDDFNVRSTFWKFEPRTTQDNFCPLRVKWYSTLQKVQQTTQVSFFTMTFTSLVHTASLSLVRSILRHEWRENSTLLSIMEVHSGSLRAVRPEARFLGHECRDHLLKCRRELIPPVLRWFFVSSTFFNFKSSTTHN